MFNLKITKNKKIILTVVLAIILLLIMLLMVLNRKNILPNIINPKEKMEPNIEISYRKTKVNVSENKAKVLVVISSDNGIEKVTNPDGEEITPIDGRNKLALDYEVNIGEEYIFKIKNTSGNEVERGITVTPIGEIYTIEDLEEVNLALTENYKLMNNLDFHNRNNYRTQERYEYYNKDEDNDGNPDNSWTPLGPFTKKFDGDYYTISNLYVNRDVIGGLFNTIGVDHGSDYWVPPQTTTLGVCNLVIKNGYVNGGSNAGLLAGYISCDYRIENVKASGTVYGSGSSRWNNWGNQLLGC